MQQCRAAMGWMGGLRLPRLAGRPDSLDWLIIAISALGAALVMARTLPHGVGLTHDSLYYIEVARNVLAGEGLVNHDGAIHTIWPPGYPLLLTVAGLGIADPHTIAAPLNAVLFGLTIFAVGRYLRELLETRFLALWACLAIALSLPLADLARFAMPETAFILFATLALIQTDRALRDDGRSVLVWAAILCALAWQMRYIGAAVPALAGLALLLQMGMPLARRLRRTALFAAIAGAPMALWLLRTYLAYLEQGWVPETGVGFSPAAILRDTARILAGWGQPLPVWLLGVVLAVVVIGLGVLIARGNKPCARRACLIFGGFALAYAALLGAAIMLGQTWEGVQPRYVAVLYIPMVVIAAFVLDGLFGWARDRQAAAGNAGGLPMIGAFARGRWANRLAAIALAGGLCAWIAAQAIDNADHIARANSGELYLGHAGQRWTESETLRYLRDYLSGAIIYTNIPVAAHFHTGENADYRRLKDVALNPDESLRWAAENEGAYVVWVDDRNFGQEFRPIHMRALEGMEPVAEFADGAAFRLNGSYTLTPGANPYIDAYFAIESGDATRHSLDTDFDVYVHQDTLIYFKSSCAAADAQDRFFLHIFADNVADLPAEFKANGFENLDFEFERRGALFRDSCVALMPLPRYEFERIITGQYAISGQDLWKAEVAGTAGLPYRQAHNAANAGEYGGVAARSDFDLYIDNAAESRTLIYIKEPCAADDTQARFFLHFFADDASDLPADSKPSGFENLDFKFADYGLHWGEICVALRELPRYEYERIRTGQHIGGDAALWQAAVAGTSARRYRQAHNAATAGDYGNPAARSNFAVYLDAESKALIYVKEQCVADDTRARFFLHIVPEDASDLPDDRKPSGFDNLDFRFTEYGANLGEVCVAMRELPRYEIGSIRTGQHVSGEGALWRVEFGVGGE